MYQRCMIMVGLLCAVWLIPLHSPGKNAIKNPMENREQVVIHLRHFSDDLHSVFMALKAANWMQGSQAQVTLFVDLEGARLADSRQSLELGWGKSKKQLAHHLKDFINAGGQVLVCPHCAGAVGLTRASIRKGATLGTQAKIADMLLSAHKILDY